MSKILTAVFDGDVLRPDSPLDLQPNTRYVKLDSTHFGSMEVTPTLVTLAFESHPIRYFDIDDVMEWVADDVCAAVQLSGRAKTQALERLDPDDLVSRTANILGRRQRLVTVTEAGLYHLLCHSDKTIAKRFKRWLCREVIQAVNSGEMEAHLAVASRQIHQLKERLELASITAQSAQTALKDSSERVKWSERTNELKSRQVEQQRQELALLKDQLASTQQELKQCQKIIVQTAHLLGEKAMEIHYESDPDFEGRS